MTKDEYIKDVSGTVVLIATFITVFVGLALQGLRVNGWLLPWMNVWLLAASLMLTYAVAFYLLASWAEREYYKKHGAGNGK